MKLTFYASIEKKFFNNFKKKINAQLVFFNDNGFDTKFEITHDLTFRGYLLFLKNILFCQTKYIFIRAVGLRSILLMPVILYLRLKKKYIVLEIPTPFSSVLYEYKINKLKRNSDTIYYILFILFGPIFLNFFNKIVGYGKEKFPYNFFIDNKFILESNSYDVESISYIAKKKLLKTELNIGMVGSIAPWHGVDRILESIKIFEKNQNIYKINFYITGYIDSKYKDDILKFIKINNLRLNIEFNESLYNEDLFNFYDKIHIGLGSLGLIKVNNISRSELKIREYTSVGLPFIMEAEDSNFPKNLPFLYSVKYGDSIINFFDIIEWYNNLDEKIPLKMRKYALDNLSFKKKKNLYFK